MVIAICYLYIALNQIEFGGLTDDEKEELPYRTLSGAWFYVWDITLGVIYRHYYEFGNKSEY